MPTALGGMRVIDLTHHITGPFCTKLLADYGAQVVKIERPGVGDPARRLAPFLHDEPGTERSGLFLHLNTNKRSVTIDLKTDAGRAVLLDLVAHADVVVESFAPRVLPSLGLDYEALRAANPDLVMASISNFGQQGPYRDYKMSELTMHSNGLPHREPIKLAGTVQQIFAGMVAAAAVLGAYVGHVRNGGSTYVDLSLFEIMATHQDRGLMATAGYQYTGNVGKRNGGDRGGLPPASAYPTADGFVQMFALNQVWRSACLLIDRPDLIDDPHFTAPGQFDDEAVRDEFYAMWLDWLSKHNKQDVMVKAQAVGYIAGAVNTVEDAFADPQLTSREFFVEVDHPSTGPLRYPGAPFKMSRTPWQPGRAPLLGEHTDQVLEELLGYDAKRIGALRAAGALS